MKTRFAAIVCLLLVSAVPLAAQTLTMTNGWNQAVTAEAQNSTAGGPLLQQALSANGGSWNTTLPANGNTLLQIVFLQGTTSLANTPLYVMNVTGATLLQSSSSNVLIVKLTPVNPMQHEQHAIVEANDFLSMKPPTKEFCLVVTRLTGNQVRLANGLVLAAIGNLKALPAQGKDACVCGHGVAPEKKNGIERFDVKSRCLTK